MGESLAYAVLHLLYVPYMIPKIQYVVPISFWKRHCEEYLSVMLLYITCKELPVIGEGGERPSAATDHDEPVDI